MLHYPDRCRSSQPRQELRKNQWDTSIKTIVAGAASRHLLARSLYVVRPPVRSSRLVSARVGNLTLWAVCRETKESWTSIGALHWTQGSSSSPSALHQPGRCIGPSWACWGWVRRHPPSFSPSLCLYLHVCVHLRMCVCLNGCVCVCIQLSVCIFTESVFISKSFPSSVLFPVLSGQSLPEADALLEIFWGLRLCVFSGIYFSPMDTDCCWA